MQDFLIIGAGVAGLAAAARLAETGASVTILETEDATGFHASGRSAASFVAQYGNEVIRALNEASADDLAHADGGVLSPRGFSLHGTAAQKDVFERDADNLGLQRLTIDEARALIPLLNPANCAYSAWREDVWDVDTHQMMQNFLRRARAAGAQLHLRSPVSALLREDGAWQAEAGGQRHRARAVVNAAGAWAGEIARMAGATPIEITPYRRSMARVPAPEGTDIGKWPFLHGAGQSWYAKPDAGSLIVSPSEEDATMPHDAWADDMVLAEGLARYNEIVDAPVTRLEASWAGLRSFAPDRALVVGEDPAAPGFWWMAGQGGYGFQTAFAASRLLADLAQGRTPELAPHITAQLLPDRFA